MIAVLVCKPVGYVLYGRLEDASALTKRLFHVDVAISQVHNLRSQRHEQVTILFADIVGFTDLSDQLPPSEV
eukprot:1143906-Pelagomonas_calceolata.AAC.3